MRRDAIRDDIGRDERRDEVDTAVAAGAMFFVVFFSLCGYLSSHHWLYTYIITLYLLSFIHLSSLISIPIIIIQSIQFI